MPKMNIPFKDRADAGRILVAKLAPYAQDLKALVLALPGGGVPVAYEVAVQLHLPLDVLIVRKLGVPGREEMAFGAIASGGVRTLNKDIVKSWHIPNRVIESISALEQRELERREHAYRDDRPLPSFQNKTVLLIDDGLATGATMQAAVAAVRKHHPAQIVVAVPVAAPATCSQLRAIVDDVVCVITPEPLDAVGLWYEVFDQTTDDEVKDLLRRASQ